MPAKHGSTACLRTASNIQRCRRTRYFPGMAAADADKTIYVQHVGHLSTLDIAHATAVAPSTVRAWLTHRSAPSGVRAARLAELSSLVERLTRIVSPAYIPVWLTEPVPALGNERPIDRIALGDHRTVARLVSGIEDPGAS